jgi:hypothetical protein
MKYICTQIHNYENRTNGVMLATNCGPATEPIINGNRIILDNVPA